jgi:MFS family permease
MGLSGHLGLLMAYLLAFAWLNGLAYAVTAPFLRDLGYTSIEYGIIAATAALASIAGSLAAGLYVDRGSAKLLVVLGTLASAPGYALLAVGVLHYVVLAVVVGSLAGGASHVAFNVLASRVFEEREYDRVYSYTSAAYAVGSGLGGFTGWLPVALLGGTVAAYKMTLLAVAAITPLTALLILPVADPGPKPRSIVEPLATSQPAWRPIARFAVFEAVIGFGAAVSIHIVDYYFALKYKVTSGELGTIIGAESLIMGLLMLLMPRLSRSIGGPLRAYLVVAGSSIPLLLAMTLVDDLVVAALLYIARTVLMNVANPLLQAFQMQIIPSGHRGRGLGLIAVAGQLPIVFGRGLGGYLMSVDVELPLRVTSAIYAAGLAMLALMFKSHLLTRFSSSS